jgi:hypothetical protein
MNLNLARSNQRSDPVTWLALAATLVYLLTMATEYIGPLGSSQVQQAFALHGLDGVVPWGARKALAWVYIVVPPLAYAAAVWLPRLGIWLVAGLLALNVVFTPLSGLQVTHGWTSFTQLAIVALEGALVFALATRNRATTSPSVTGA